MSRPLAHDEMWGSRKGNDVLLYEESFERGFVLLQHVYDEVIYPPKNCKPTFIISCIIARDGWDDGTGGKAYVVEGGVGYNYVKMSLKSQFGRGMSFRVQIYGVH